MFENRKYVIIAETEKDNVNFDDLLTSSIDTARYSVDKSNILLSYEGETPSYFDGKTIYTYSEIKDVMSSSDWAGVVSE